MKEDNQVIITFQFEGPYKCHWSRSVFRGFKHRAHILIGREREGSRDLALASPPIRCRDF